MQQTDKWNLNLIETDDEIVESLRAINENFNKIDENMGTGGGGGGVSEETDPTVPEHVKNIQESDIENWNNKQNKLTAGSNITIDENGVISSTGGGGGETPAPVEPYVLPIASATVLGGIKVGNNLYIDENGVLSAVGGGGGGEGGATVLVFENVVVQPEEWKEDETYEQFLSRADIPCAGVTADFFPDVVFGLNEALSGNYAPISSTGAGVVTIYAVNAPEEPITILSIKCSKGA